MNEILLAECSLVDFFWHWHQKTKRHERVCLWPNLHHEARWPRKEEWICPHGLLVVAAGYLCQKHSWTMETRSWPYFDPDYERNGTRNNPPRSVTHPNSVLYGSGVAITCFRHFLHHTLTWSTHPQYAVARCLYLFGKWQLCRSFIMSMDGDFSILVRVFFLENDSSGCLVVLFAEL
jgi:hypothetical protein